MKMEDMLLIFKLLALIAGFVIFLGNPKAREHFKNGILAIGRVLDSEPAKKVIAVLIGAATFLMLALAFMTGFLKVADGQAAMGIGLSMAMTVCAIGYALCNHRLFFA